MQCKPRRHSLCTWLVLGSHCPGHVKSGGHTGHTGHVKSSGRNQSKQYPGAHALGSLPVVATKQQQEQERHWPDLLMYQLSIMTRNRMRVAIESDKGMKVKVLK